MEKENLIECKMCCREISPRAQKCPYCLHYQKVNAMYKDLMPIWIMAVIFPIIIIGVGFMVIDSRYDEGEPFAEYASAVSVVDTKMVFGAYGGEGQWPTVVILGKIQNDSPISWEDVKLEAVFFDREGSQFDVTQREFEDFVVVSHDASFFKLSVRREFPQEQYKSFKVRVISAKDERKPF